MQLQDDDAVAASARGFWHHLKPLADGRRWRSPGMEIQQQQQEAAKLPLQDVPLDKGVVAKVVARKAQKSWIASWRPGFYRETMEDKLPPPVEDVDREVVVDVH